MRLIIVTGLACQFLTGALVPCLAEPATTATAEATTATAKPSQTEGLFHFWFRDSVTGVAVKPDAILLDEKMIFNRIDESGRVTFPASLGDHTLLVKAKGYNDLQSRQTCVAGEMLTNVVMLDPTVQPEELRPENLSKGMTPKSSVIAGFIVDSQLCRPVDDAVVEILDHGTTITAKSSKTGFFSVVVPLKNPQPLPDDKSGKTFDTAHFRITKDGYGADEYRNVMLESGSPRIYQIELARGGGGNFTDEEENRNNLKSGLFGKFNVEHKE